MEISYIEDKNGPIAVVSAGEKVITDVQSALDLAMTARYEGGAGKIAICKEAVSEDFFILSTGLAGEILQKFTNYHIKAAFYGDFSPANLSTTLFMSPTRGTAYSSSPPERRRFAA